MFSLVKPNLGFALCEKFKGSNAKHWHIFLSFIKKMIGGGLLSMVLPFKIFFL